MQIVLNLEETFVCVVVLKTTAVVEEGDNHLLWAVKRREGIKQGMEEEGVQEKKREEASGWWKSLYDWILDFNIPTLWTPPPWPTFSLCWHTDDSALQSISLPSSSFTLLSPLLPLTPSCFCIPSFVVSSSAFALFQKLNLNLPIIRSHLFKLILKLPPFNSGRISSFHNAE